MNLSELSIATIRALGIDMINKANSGHPGMTLGSAPALYTLFTKHLVTDVKDSHWFNRDRFVLASGHASALLYSLLHLSGFEVTIDDLKQFRQWGSRTPGHPEVGVTDGVDASSGPLGQGIPMAVGMSLAEKFLGTKYNREGLDVVNHYTYVLCGDGDLQEGVTYEACSLAGHLSLGKLIVLYDANKVTLDGALDLSFSENVKKRFDAQGWQVLELMDGNDIASLDKLIKKAKKEAYKPTLIMMHTTIGFGSQNEGTSKVHGAPLGVDDGNHAKLSYGLASTEPFTVSEDVYEDFKKTIAKRGKSAHKKYQKMMAHYAQEYPEAYEEFMALVNGDYSIAFDEVLPRFAPEYNDATRNTSHQVIKHLAQAYPTLIGGAADLASSTKSNIGGEEPFLPGNYSGRNLSFGIREFAMVAMMNGIMLHGGMRVISGGFMVFSDYFKAGLRMAALMELPIILPLSHDSIAVGEDGPTHQPIEQLAMLRSIPNVQVLRPCDANETVAAYQLAMESQTKPTVIALTRQNVPNHETSSYEGVKHGAYIISSEKEHLDAILLASGSEVELALHAQIALAKENIDVRVVSVPSFELFNAQSKEYKEEVLPSACRRRISIEMARDFGWHQYVGLDGKCVSVETFGASAPAAQVIKNYGFTVEHIVSEVKSLL